jgi:hypothetical protein
MPRQDDLNAVLVDDLTDLKGRVQVLNDVPNVMDWAVDAAIEQLEQGGQLAAEDGLLEEYRRAIGILRTRGFTRPKTGGGASVTCPGCKANLKGVAGKTGDRCSWCGFVFP